MTKCDVVDIATVLGNKVTKTVSKNTTVQNHPATGQSNSTKQLPLTSLDTQSVRQVSFFIFYLPAIAARF